MANVLFGLFQRYDTVCMELQSNQDTSAWTSSKAGMLQAVYYFSE